MTALVRRAALPFLTLLIPLLIADAALADDFASVIQIAVRTPDVRIKIDVIPEAVGVTRRAEPGDDGIATIPYIRPGRYVVIVTTEFGLTARLTIDVGASEQWFLDVKPGGAGIAPEIRVVRQARLDHGTEIRSPELQNFQAADSLTTLLETVMPFVTVDRFSSGGLDTARSGLAGAPGTSWTESTLRFGDADFRTPSVRGWTYVPDLTAASAVTVRSGTLPLAVGAPGAAISIEPRRPGRTPESTIESSFATPGLMSKSGSNVAPPIERLDSYAHVGVETGGSMRRPVSGLVSVFGSRGTQFERSDPVAFPAGIVSGTAFLIAHPAPHDEIRVLAGTQDRDRPFEDRRQFLDRHVNEDASSWFSQATWDRVGRNESFRELSFGGQQSQVTPGADTYTAGGTIERVFEGPLPDPAAFLVESHWNVRGRYAPPPVTRFGRRHQFDFGLSFDRMSLVSQVVAAPPIAELVAGLPARVWVTDPSTADSGRHVNDVVMSAADRAWLGEKATLDMSLQAEFSNGSADWALRGISWRSLSPRAALTIAGPVTFLTGFARYHRPLTVDALAFGDPGAPLRRVYRWEDPNHDGRFESGEQGQLVALAGRNASIASIDQAIRQPYLWEWYIGAERQLTRTMRLGVTCTFKSEYNLPRSVNVGVPASSYVPVTLIDPMQDPTAKPASVVVYDRLPSSFGRDHYLLTNVAGDHVSYAGLDATWELRTQHWYSTFGGTAYTSHAAGGNRGFGVLEADPGVIGEHFETPNTVGISVGHTFFDHNYVGKISTSYLAPHGVTASVTARYQDGQPFSLLVVGPTLAQGPDLISADRPGHTRFTFTGTIDARLEKRFAMRAYRGALSVDVFNLTNRSDEVEENPIGGPTFRLSTALQPPRTMRVNVRFEF